MLRASTFLLHLLKTSSEPECDSGVNGADQEDHNAGAGCSVSEQEGCHRSLGDMTRAYTTVTFELLSCEIAGLEELRQLSHVPE